MIDPVEQVKEKAQRLLDQLRTANPKYADRFRLGVEGLSVLFLTDKDRYAILASGLITNDGKLYDGQTAEGKYLTIDRAIVDEYEGGES